MKLKFRDTLRNSGSDDDRQLEWNLRHKLGASIVVQLLNCCLQWWHSIWASLWVPAVPVLSKPPANIFEKWGKLLPPTSKIQMEIQAPGFRMAKPDHFRSELAGGKPLFPSISISFLSHPCITLLFEKKWHKVQWGKKRDRDSTFRLLVCSADLRSPSETGQKYQVLIQKLQRNHRMY